MVSFRVFILTESEKQVLSNIAEKLEASLAMSNGKASAYQNQLIETTSKREELLLKSLAQITELQVIHITPSCL